MATVDVLKACKDALEALRPDDVAALSNPALDKFLSDLAVGSPGADDALQSKTAGLNPRAPVQAILQEIAAFASVIYTVYDVAGKVDGLTDLALDPNKQEEVVNKAIAKLRKLRLTYPADHFQSMLDEYLDYVTRPRNKDE